MGRVVVRDGDAMGVGVRAHGGLTAAGDDFMLCVHDVDRNATDRIQRD